MPNELDVPVVPQYADDDPTPYRRSLRASRARRVAALRRRRTVRGRRSLTCALLTMSLLAVGASADTSAPAPVRAASTSSVAAAQKALGVTADGVVGPITRKAVRAFQRQKGLTVDGVIGPQTLGALGISAASGAKDATRSATAANAAAAAQGASPLLESIALCESGGDPTLVSSSGQYRGKYQFDRATWRSIGGSGDPAAASEGEQDRMAAKLLAARGTAPWPVCGSKVGASG